MEMCNGNNFFIHVDHYNIAFHPDYNGTTNKKMFIVNDGGVFRTDNASANASSRCAPLTNQIVWRNTNAGANWSPINGTGTTALPDAARTVLTNSTGNYTFMNMPAGRNYTIKPTKTGYTFTPVTKSITNLSANITAGAATNFTGTQ